MRLQTHVALVSIGLAVGVVMSCAKSPTMAALSSGPLPAPTPASPACGSVNAWPTEPLALDWDPVEGAVTYTVEVDCMGCGSLPDPWFSQSGRPWHIEAGLTESMYVSDVVARLRSEGGRAMRWRVRAVDASMRDGELMPWCIAAFSEDGLPTPQSAELPAR